MLPKIAWVINADLSTLQLSVLSAARVGLAQSSEDCHHSIVRKFAAMRARIADERSNKLERRRLLRRTSAHNPVPVFIGEYREVLHRLHISPTGERFPRAWDVDVPPGALSAALEALTIACQLIRVFDCGRAPCKGDSGNQPNQPRRKNKSKNCVLRVSRAQIDLSRPGTRRLYFAQRRSGVMPVLRAEE